MGTDVNKEGRSVPASLPRASFFHWVLVDIPRKIWAEEVRSEADDALNEFEG